MTIDLKYTGMHLDRGDVLRRSTETLDQFWNHEQCRVLPVLENRNLFSIDPLLNGQVEASICLRSELSPFLEKAEHRTFLGVYDKTPHFSVEIHAEFQEELTAYVSGKFIDLRSVGPQLEKNTAALLAYARALTYWQRHNRFCSLSGHALKATHGGHVLECSDPECGHTIYPRTDPAVIMLVERVDENGIRKCLLGRHPNWTPKAVSTLAGFVEPGESLEEAVRREVLEEAGIHVGKVSYIASQPWPFPSSIMLGFIAQATSAEITLDTHELAEADWFSKSDLQSFGEWGEESDRYKLPRGDSISSYLIHHWLNSPDCE
ncbi:MAG: NADH pyrophosphatase (EC [uncultured Thiotrichaceae bacterium]|uniref:NAD(+) diphosphatase n=1 Tax=uncultured Thiotrichaceae bacterium TaxID=298394 RepID=A0A6S6TCF7_9GAMM|nr:MAG: NADH pyrophosphatase (EC [uncultured Thiotrichaceae bacterium]